VVPGRRLDHSRIYLFYKALNKSEGWDEGWFRGGDLNVDRFPSLQNNEQVNG